MASPKATQSAPPKGFTPVASSSYADTWDPNPGDILQGVWTGTRMVEVTQGRETVERAVGTVRTDTGEEFAVWESANLRGLFQAVKLHQQVWIRFDGIGESSKKGFSPPKLYTVALGDIAVMDDDIPF